MKAKKGISLIVLVITIIVIIILAGAVILNLSKNNPMDSAKIASVTSSRESLESAITLYLSKVIAATSGDYDSTQILTGTASGYSALTAGSAVTVTGLDTGSPSTLYKLDDTAGVARAALDMDLPTTTTTNDWYVNVATGKCYLVYTNSTSYPSFMGSAANGTVSTTAPFSPTNTTLSAFVVSLAQ